MSARKIKLVDTGEIVEKTSAIYQAPNKRYFSSYDAYLEWDMEDKYRQECVEKMYEFFGLDTKQKLNGRFYSYLKDWRAGYDYHTILKAMELSTEPIEYAFRTKEFQDDAGKMAYCCAIIQNKLNDALVQVKRMRRVNKIETSDNTQGIAEDMDVLCNMKTKVRANDISHLLGDI